MARSEGPAAVRRCSSSASPISSPSLAQHGDRVVVDGPDVNQICQVIAYFGHSSHLIRPASDDGHGSRVLQDRGDLLGARRFRRSVRSPRPRTRPRSRTGSTRTSWPTSIAIRSPRCTPAAISPLATPETWSRNSAAVTSYQSPEPGGRLKRTVDAASRAVGHDVVSEVSAARERCMTVVTNTPATSPPLARWVQAASRLPGACGRGSLG